MNADGSGQLRIANSGSHSCSPDGARIAFAGNDGLYVMNSDGTGQAQLTNGTADDFPVWSPDGTKIAFARFQDNQDAIYVMNADGSGVLDVFEELGVRPYQPIWSPDATQLVFEALVSVSTGTNGHPDYNYDIYVVSADGDGLVDLTPTSDRAENSPVWAPDGSEIGFEATRTLNGENAGTFDIYIISPDGTNEQRVTTDQHAGGFDLSWQPVTGTPTPSP